MEICICDKHSYTYVRMKVLCPLVYINIDRPIFLCHPWRVMLQWFFFRFFQRSPFSFLSLWPICIVFASRMRCSALCQSFLFSRTNKPTGKQTNTQLNQNAASWLFERVRGKIYSTLLLLLLLLLLFRSPPKSHCRAVYLLISSSFWGSIVALPRKNSCRISRLS